MRAEKDEVVVTSLQLHSWQIGEVVHCAAQWWCKDCPFRAEEQLCPGQTEAGGKTDKVQQILEDQFVSNDE